MKRTFFLLFFVVFLFQTNNYSFADGDQNGDVIDVTYVNPGQSLNRTQGFVPISVIYYSLNSYIAVLFLDNLGDVTITLYNLTTGATAATQVNAGIGTINIPVTLGSGYYRISFVTEGGTTYEGFFSVL